MSTCNHPRPRLNLPGYTPPRFAWQPPAYLPTDPAALTRSLTEAFRGIYAVLQQLGQRRTVVPLIEDIEARAGQVIVGVGAGQTILLPEGVGGELGQVGIVLTDVSSPVTVVHPDGTTTQLGAAGAYDFVSGIPDAYQTNPGGTTTAGDGLSGGGGTPLSVDVAAIAGAGLESDGSNNLRIAASAAGAGLTGGAGLALAVGAGTGLTVNADDVQLATIVAKSILANATNATLVPSALAGSGAFQHLRVNAANTGLEWAVLSLATFPTMATGTFLANITGSTAVPTAHPLATFAGAGLTYTNVTGILAVGAGTHITANANDVAVNLTTLVPAIDSASVIANATVLERAALTGFAEAGQNSNATTSAEPIVTFAASANMSNERVLSNGTRTTVDLGTVNQAKIDWNGVGIYEADGVTFVKNAHDLFALSSASVIGDAVDTGGAGAGFRYERAALTGDITAAQNSNVTVIADNTVGNGQLVNMAQSTIKGRAEGAGTGDPQDLTPTQVVAVIDAESPTWTGAHNFTGATFTVATSGDVTIGSSGDDVLITASDDISVTAGDLLTITAGTTVAVESPARFRSTFRIDNPISPSALTGNVNNYAPTGWPTANVVRLSTNGTAATTWDITGALAGVDGEIKYLVGLGPGNIRLQHENASSTAANRFRFTSLTTFTINPEDMVGIWYDGDSDRWRVMSFININ